MDIVTKESARKKEFFLYPHNDCQDGEILLQFANQTDLDELKRLGEWKTLRTGPPEPEPYNDMLPLFVKQQELTEAGGIIMTIKECSSIKKASLKK